MNLFLNLSKFSSNTCVIDENYNKFTYSDLVDLSNKFTSKIKTRSVVFLLCSNTYEFLACYVGLVRKKIVPFLVDRNINAQDLSNLEKLYKPQFIIKPIYTKINISNLNEIDSFNKNYHILKTNNKPYKVKSNLALLVSTSGSTGSPKFVKISYTNIFDNAKKISIFLKISSRDKVITTLQPNYIYGLSILNSHIINGSVVVMSQLSLVEKKFWDLFKKTKITTFGGVPYTYSILKKLKFNQMKLPHLRYITQAGGKLSLELLDEFINVCNKKKIKLIVMYGQTEAAGRISYLDWNFIEKKRGSIGKPIEGGKFYLHNAKSDPTDNNFNIGELVYTGKNVMLGYANKKSDLNKANHKQKLFTGDLARKDADGFYFIQGRNNRLIKITGYRLNLDEMEQVFRKKNINCICAGTDDSLKIFLQKKIKHAAINIIIKEKYNINKINYSIYSKVSIPRNQNGKILYSKLNVFKN